MEFGLSAKSIIGHGSQALIEQEVTLTNNSDYDMLYDELCIKKTLGGAALTGGEYCTSLNDEVIYEYETIKYSEYRDINGGDLPSYIGNKDGVMGDSYEDATITASIKTNGIAYYGAYFAESADLRVAKPAIVTTGGGTSYVKSTTTADIADVTDNAIGDTNFVWVSAGSGSVSSNVEVLTVGSDAQTSIESERDIYEQSVEEITTETFTPALDTVTGFSDTYNGLDNVFIVRGKNVDLSTLPAVSKPTTYIVEGGDLTIKWNIEADHNVAFVVRNGNIIINDNVETIDGTYVVLWTGEIIGQPSAEQLVVNGSLYGNIDQLVNNRYYISDDTSGPLSVGTIVSFGSSLFSRPAPLVSQFVGEYLESEKVVR